MERISSSLPAVGVLQMAKNMLKNGLDVELISNITGLSKGVIENLKKESEDIND